MRLITLTVASLITVLSVATSDAAPRLNYKKQGSYAASQQAANNGGELYMINVQSLVSKRQIAVQLTTNMLGPMNEANRTIVQNMGGGCQPNC